MTDPVIVQIPTEVDNLQLPDPNLLSFYKEKEERLKENICLRPSIKTIVE